MTFRSDRRLAAACFSLTVSLCATAPAVAQQVDALPRTIAALPGDARIEPALLDDAEQLAAFGFIREADHARNDFRVVIEIARKPGDDTFETSRRNPSLDRLDKFQKRAFAMLTSSKTRDAFDLSKEPDRVRERYGRNLYGSSMIVARRLVEAGVPFVSVHQEIFRHYGHAYDMHENNFGMLKNHNLPILDQVYPALIQDLEDRGLLDSTLVIVMGEMGRSPKVNGKAGRDHWPQCGFSLLTGGGIKPGMVYGATDKQAAYPVNDPVSPANLVATIYHLLGIDPHMTVSDRTGRPYAIAQGGDPVKGVLA